MGHLGTAAIAAMAGSVAARQSAGPPSKLRLAIVGIGGFARVALERLPQARRVSLAGFASGDPAKARRTADEWGVAAPALYTYPTFDRLADDPRVDAVHICLPVGLHAEYVERALRAGKHVLCEKPLAATAADARRLVALAEATGKVLMPAHRAWYSGAVQAALRRVRERALGVLVAVDAHKGFRIAVPAGNWRFDPGLAGGGALFDIGPYSVQLTRWAAGGLPRRVTAVRAGVQGDDRFRRVEPHLAWTLEFDSGVVATGSASWRYRLQNHATLGLERGWLRLDPATPIVGERLLAGLDDPARVEEVMLPVRDQLPSMYDDFAAAALDGTAPGVTAADAVADLVVMEALYRAAESGTAVDVEG